MTGSGRVDNGASPDVDSADVDEAFRLLASGDRRAVMYVLREQESATVDELADVVAGRRAAEEGTFVPPSRWGRIRIELDHVQLPMLEDGGVLDYDREAGRVTRAGTRPAVAALVDCELVTEAGADVDPSLLDGGRRGGQ